jgi:hypothetical protein
MHLRRLRPGEFDHERVWLAVSLVSALIGWAVLQAGLPLPQCTWHQVTGLPCPGCGGTRCVRALVEGSLWKAFMMNPLAFIGLGLIGLYDLYAATVLIFRLPRIRIDHMPEWLGSITRFGAAAAVLGNWAWLIVARR